MINQKNITTAIAAIALALTACVQSYGAEGHDDHDEKAHAEAPKSSEHEHDGGEEHGDDHGGEEQEETNSSVGPDKGITKFDKKLGFQLRDEAVKTFKLATVQATPGAAMTLPSGAIFFGLEERNVYRLRDGYYKRIDFKLLSKTKTHSTVQLDDIRSGDQIVVGGLGFLRVAEITASGGGAAGHAH